MSWHPKNNNFLFKKVNNNSVLTSKFNTSTQQKAFFGLLSNSKNTIFNTCCDIQCLITTIVVEFPQKINKDQKGKILNKWFELSTQIYCKWVKSTFVGFFTWLFGANPWVVLSPKEGDFANLLCDSLQNICLDENRGTLKPQWNDFDCILSRVLATAFPFIKLPFLCFIANKNKICKKRWFFTNCMNLAFQYYCLAFCNAECSIDK